MLGMDSKCVVTPRPDAVPFDWSLAVCSILTLDKFGPESELVFQVSKAWAKRKGSLKEAVYF